MCAHISKIYRYILYGCRYNCRPLYVPMCIVLYSYKYVYTYTRSIYICIAYMFTHMHMQIGVRVYVHTHTRTHGLHPNCWPKYVNIYMQIRIYVDVYICCTVLSVFTHICIYMWSSPKLLAKACKYIHANTYIHICICMLYCIERMYTYMYIYTLGVYVHKSNATYITQKRKYVYCVFFEIDIVLHLLYLHIYSKCVYIFDVCIYIIDKFFVLYLYSYI